MTGSLLSVASRLQTYFCARYFRKEKPIIKAKKGAVIVVGGGDGNVTKPYNTACSLLHHMNANEVLPVVFSHHTNEIPAIEDETAIKGVQNIIEYFNN